MVTNPQPAPEKEPAAKPSFSARFKAWWLGDDYKDIPTAPAAEQKIEPPPVSAAPIPPPVEEKKEEAVRELPEDPIWPRMRLALAQQVWGARFTGAGGEELALATLKHFSPLSRGMYVLDMNAQIGGTVQLLASKYGAQAEGLEMSETLVKIGQSLLLESKLEPPPIIQDYNPETIELDPHQYDAILMPEILALVTDKERFLNEAYRALKERGQLIITDFVLGQEGLQSKKIMDWTRSEPYRPNLWSEDAIISYLSDELNMEIRKVENITPKYKRYVSRGWKQYLEKAAQNPPGDEWRSTLMREVNFWVKRIEILDSGDVQFTRITARKKAATDL